MNTSPFYTTDMPQRLVLASASRYRAEQLSRLGLMFETCSSNIDERAIPGESVADMALRLSVAKAEAVADRFPNALIIGSDQSAALDGKTLGKPGNYDNAFRQLKACQGQTIIFHSALCLLNTKTGHKQVRDVQTHVRFRTLPDDIIERYLRAEQPYDCAGSAKTEGLGILLLSEIQSDDPSAIIGLPLIALVDMLNAENYPII